MRRIVLLALSLVLMSIVLLGCQVEHSSPSKAEAPNPELQLNLDGEIIRINISKSGVSPIVIDKGEALESFKSIISSAKREKGIVNMANPEFRLDILYENDKKQSFYLWVGEKRQQSTLMKTEDTNTVYTVSEEMTNILLNLL